MITPPEFRTICTRCSTVFISLMMAFMFAGCAVVPGPAYTDGNVIHGSGHNYNYLVPSPFFSLGVHGVHRRHKPRHRPRLRSETNRHRPGHAPRYRHRRPDDRHVDRAPLRSTPDRIQRPQRRPNADRRGHRRPGHGQRARPRNDAAPGTVSPRRDRRRPSIDHRPSTRLERRREQDDINNQP